MTRGDKNVIQSILGGWKSFFSIGKSGDGGIYRAQNEAYKWG